MLTRKFTLALLLSLAGLILSQSASAGLLGKTLQVAYYANSTPISSTISQFTVGDSVEISIWPSTGFPSASGPIKLKIDASDTSITLSNTDESSKTWTTSSTSLLYLVFKDITNTIPDFSSDLTQTFLSKTITNLTDSDLTITNNSISLLLNGAILPAISSSGYFTIQVGFANPTPTPVPAPASILLMISGLLINRVLKSKRLSDTRTSTSIA